MWNSVDNLEVYPYIGFAIRGLTSSSAQAGRVREGRFDTLTLGAELRSQTQMFKPVQSCR